MKKLLTIAFCALFAIHAAEGRTLYVNAKRPNNKGNGLKVKSAKKTIQAAINIARKGDTILVYPGTYSPIKTGNKKITIKSVKGKNRTEITPGTATVKDDYLVDLAAWKEDGYNSEVGWTPTLLSIRKGNATRLSGFLVHGGDATGAVAGGTVSKCEFALLGAGDAYNHYMVRHAYSRASSGKAVNTWAVPTFDHVNLSDCIVFSCDQSAGVKKDSGSFIGICQSKLVRCRIRACNQEKAPFRIHDSAFQNCLIAETPRIEADKATFVNCTIVRDSAFKATKSKFTNCIIYKSGTKAFAKACKNKFTATFKDNRNPQFVSVSDGEYHLSAKSPCIDKGRKASGTGAKDLGGDRRIRGKAVDRGCFEYHEGQNAEVSFYTDFLLLDREGVSVSVEELHTGWDWGVYENNREYRNFTWKTRDYPYSRATYGSLPQLGLGKLSNSSKGDSSVIFVGWWTDPVNGKQVFPSSTLAHYRLFAHWVSLDVFKGGFSFGSAQTIGLFTLEIPEKLDGQTITKLGNDVYGSYDFTLKTSIAGISFPKTFKTLTGVFDGWTNLGQVTIPSSVNSIFFNAFANCPSLKTIRLQNGSPLVPGTDFEVPAGCTVVRY